MTGFLIFLGTYVALALGRFPPLRVDRAGAALIGACLMLAAGVLSFEEALRAVDFATLVLLLGMMIVVANLRLSGFFGWVAALVVRHAHRPRTLLAAVIGVAGVFSAFFVNDTMCLVLTPLVVEVCVALRRNAVPYLLAVAMAANAGSVATITGNPQNMLVGNLSGIAYRTFTLALAPVAAASLVVVFVVIVALYRGEFRGAGRLEVGAARVRVNRVLMWKSLLVAAGMVAAFFLGVAVAQAAIVAGGLLLITRRVKPEKVYHEIDWPLLVMFAGLFIVVAGLEKTGLPAWLFAQAAGYGLQNAPVLSAAAAGLSNLVSNVPAVLVFRPLIAAHPQPQQGWLVLAMASTLAGNFTLLASIANLIVVQRARGAAAISFLTYFRVGAPVTLITLALGTAWLMWLHG